MTSTHVTPSVDVNTRWADMTAYPESPPTTDVTREGRPVGSIFDHDSPSALITTEETALVGSTGSSETIARRPAGPMTNSETTDPGPKNSSVASCSQLSPSSDTQMIGIRSSKVSSVRTIAE